MCTWYQIYTTLPSELQETDTDLPSGLQETDTAVHTRRIIIIPTINFQILARSTTRQPQISEFGTSIQCLPPAGCLVAGGAGNAVASKVLSDSTIPLSSPPTELEE
ncbi:unnamed protein product, partial [Pylaiella littoralis]